MPISIGNFSVFFREVHGYDPFPWQSRLVGKVCGEEWPGVIDLPTASGKTACIDIALFALASMDNAPRRIFFVVDRRIVVNEAFTRMQKIAKALREASGGVLYEVATRLRTLAGGGEVDPLEVCELRGGIYREESWVRTPLQPTVVASTVDQVGSRMLFRGYGVSEEAWPIHAALVANDSLIFLDEAHCSRAFAETLSAIRRFRGPGWAEEPVTTPFRTVEMTATPTGTAEAERFEMGVDDRLNDILGRRIFASKPTRLVQIKNRPGDLDKLAEKLCSEALDLSKSVPGARRVAVIVNRVYTARAVFERLRTAMCDAHLMIGRMRPLDRDDMVVDLESLRSGSPRNEQCETKFVVSTQCLEVGADLDFDVLVSDCASIDALQQRFGRLNRLGDFGQARGSIVIGTGQIDAGSPDPIYGDALAQTWKWLNEIARDGAVDMGIEALAGRPLTVGQQVNAAGADQRARMRMPGKSAPVLLPAHLDAWVQTKPRPLYDPLVEVFLHGQSAGEPDVQVIWRADLDGFDANAWADVVSLCPPVAAEAMQVPISAFRRWYEQKDQDKEDSDIEGAGVNAEEDRKRAALGIPRNIRCHALTWKGNESELVRSGADIRPGSTIVLPASVGGIDELGHRPEGSSIDLGDRARFASKRRLSLRFHPNLLSEWPDGDPRRTIKELVTREDVENKDIREAIGMCLKDETGARWFNDLLRATQKNAWRIECYPGDGNGFVLQGNGIVRSVEEDNGNDEPSRSVPVSLEDHLRDVEEAVLRYHLLLGDRTEEYLWAARFHDFGKADIRFQTLLRSGDRMAADFAPKPLAKSGSMATNRDERRKQRERSGLPDGFRHEHLSLLFAEKVAKGDVHDLGLHLITTHHGEARPFAPVVIDDSPVEVSFGGLHLSSEERVARPAHSLRSGVSDRFWQLTRRYGWWGLAWYEALFRLADWDASAREAKP
jgi:CRISPR-associated endonuclease/helicase Cas3